MPDCLTHIFMAEDVKRKIKADFAFNLDYFILGSQGPDPFFYYNYYPWKKTNNIDKFGSKMHKHKTKLFLENLIKVSTNSSVELKSYALGFLCHYSLDTTAHPYIYNVTGNYTDKNTKKYRGNHLKLERGIDAILLKRKNINPRFYRLNGYFSLKFLNDDFISKLNIIYEKTYQMNNMGEIYSHSYTDFQSNFKILVYDPLGIKKVFYSIVDMFTSGTMMYKNLTYNANLTKYDYMNTKHTTWKHPVTGVESNKSFDDLYNEAVEKAVSLLDSTIMLFNGESSNIFNKIENTNYNTGLECNHPGKMTHINSILN